MRELTAHKVNGVNDGLTVAATDPPGHGNASHNYVIDWTYERVSPPAAQRVVIPFQNGTLKDVGTNGVTHEALLAIIEDRLVAFQAGPFKCAENANALFHVRAAMRELKGRTESRLERGVEGTHQV